MKKIEITEKQVKGAMKNQLQYLKDLKKFAVGTQLEKLFKTDLAKNEIKSLEKFLEESKADE